MSTLKKSLRRAGLLAVSLAAAVSLYQAQAAPPAIDAELVVHVEKPGAVISPEIYGQFAEHLGSGMYGGLWVGPNSKIPNVRGFRKDVVGALKRLEVPVVRWPGGCFADQYHWRDGIGARRPVRVNNEWGGVPETNAVGIHEFMDLIAQLGAKVYVNGNLGTGSPQEVKDWLEYMTSETHSSLAEERRRNGRAAPWKVDYFAFGNEPVGCGGNMRSEFYADLYHQFAAFAKTPNDNRPKWIAASAYDDNAAWTETMMASNKFGDMDAVTMHRYTLPTGNWSGSKGAATGFGEEQWISLIERALKMDGMIAAHVAVMDKYDPGKKVALYVDEWGNWYDVEPGANPGFLYQQNSLRDAITAAINLDIFQAHADRVRMTNIAQMVNVLQAMVLTDGPKMLLTPTYHVFMIYKPFRGASLLPSELKTPDYVLGDARVPAIHASAARRSDGSIVVSLVDLDPHRSAHVSVSLPSADLNTVSATILTADAMDAHNTFARPNDVRPAPFTAFAAAGDHILVDLPAKSIVVMTLRRVPR
jgi:alpha-L-arabinofuranosidase